MLGNAIVHGLADAGVLVTLVGRTEHKLKALAESVGGNTYACDMSEKASLDRVSSLVSSEVGPYSILISAIGGNMPDATLPADGSFFDLDIDALRSVVETNLFAGAVLPILAFGRHMERGSVITVGSVSGSLPLSRVGGYGAAKAAVANFTRWASMELASRTEGRLRLNTIQPGFFITDQNRSLLTTADGTLTERGRQILQHTPSGRFGEPKDLIGSILWLASEGSAFVNGAVIPIDGGFSSWWGV